MPQYYGTTKKKPSAVTVAPIVVLAGLVGLALAALWRAWVVMLLLGAFHSHYPAVPALGFWFSYALTVLANLLFHPTQSTDTVA